MPKEIFWEFSHREDDDLIEGGTRQAVRFRRPQLIKVEDIASAFRGFLDYWNNPHEAGNGIISAVLIKDEGKICRGIEEGIIKPLMMIDDHFSCLVYLEKAWQGWVRSIVIDEQGVFEKKEEKPLFFLEDDKVLSSQITYYFPLKILPTSLNIRTSTFCVTHNIPLEEKPVMGSCTWFNFTQPLTSIGLMINDDWWKTYSSSLNKKEKQELRIIWQIANDLYWFFQNWINKGLFVNMLTRKGYNLIPQFDPSWADCIMEDQCQECGRICSSLPHKISAVRVGEISKNYCNCRWKRDHRYSSAIERKFKVIGAYPVSPEEAEHALYEGSLQADSAYD